MPSNRSPNPGTPRLLAPIVGPRPRVPLVEMVFAQARLELLLTLRRGESVLITLVIPTLLLAFFGAIPLLPIEGDDRMAFLLPGMLALAVMSTAMVSLGIATAFERHYRVLKRLGGSPLPPAGLLAAKIIAVLVLELAQIALLLTFAVTLFGWRPAGNLTTAAPALLLGTAAFGGLGLWMAGSLRAELTLALANGLYLVLLLLGGMVVPVSQLPAPLAAIAGWLPSTALADALRAALGGAAPPLASLGVLAIWAVLMPLLAARCFRWE